MRKCDPPSGLRKQPSPAGSIPEVQPAPLNPADSSVSTVRRKCDRRSDEDLGQDIENPRTVIAAQNGRTLEVIGIGQHGRVVDIRKVPTLAQRAKSAAVDADRHPLAVGRKREPADRLPGRPPILRPHQDARGSRPGRPPSPPAQARRPLTIFSRPAGDSPRSLGTPAGFS